MSVVEYVYLGGNKELRSKTKVMKKKITEISELPELEL